MTPDRRLAARLLPLQVAVAGLGFLLWVPVEKLFMSEIGFTPATVGVMAAAYAAVVPLLEIPSGLLADRSSRSWVLVGASVTLAASSILGALSHHVLTYIAAAVVLGGYFALSSGTIDSIVYDTVLEETGSSDLYERWIGRIRLSESAALAVSALAGGLLAGLTTVRVTYWATVPFLLLAVVALLRLQEPRLHRAQERIPVREHLLVALRTMTRRTTRRLLLLCALTGLLSQAVFELGPLWLVAVDAPAAVYGPYWAGLVATLGAGGLLAARVDLDRPRAVVLLAVAVPVVTIGLAATEAIVVVAVQLTLALALAVLAIHAGHLLHDAVPSTIRTAVASGVGTLTWLLFMPFSLASGVLADTEGVSSAGWLFVGAAAAVGVLLVAIGARPRVGRPQPADEGDGAAPGLVCRDLVELVMDLLDGRLPKDREASVREHLAVCDGCSAYVSQIEALIRALAKPERPPC